MTANEQLRAKVTAAGNGSTPLLFHPPKQSRSQQTLDRIASAAVEIMEEEGVGGATVAAIVERAGASVGSFYARFPGKSDLVRYLQERVWTEARERWDQALEAQAWEGLPMVSLVEGVAGLLLRSIQEDFHRRKVLGREGISDLETARRILDFHEHILATVTPLFLARSQEMTHPDPSVGIRFGYLFVVGAIREFLELEETQPSSTETLGALPSPDRLGPELARAWIGYLRPETPIRTAEEEGEADFFDPWG